MRRILVLLLLCLSMGCGATGTAARPWVSVMARSLLLAGDDEIEFQHSCAALGQREGIRFRYGKTELWCEDKRAVAVVSGHYLSSRAGVRSGASIYSTLFKKPATLKVLGR